MLVKPAVPGAIVRDPRTLQPLPSDGLEVPRDSYWQRRLQDKDVVEVAARPAAKPVKE